MRAEEKELEGQELVREEKKDRDELEHEEWEEMPAGGERFRDAESFERGQLFGAIRDILDGEDLQLGELRLPQRELFALEALKAATSGRDPQFDKFVYAEDRTELLEQALAVLQSNLTSGELAEAGLALEAVSRQIGELRQHLHQLESAEEEIERREHAESKGETDSDDKPEAEDEDAPKTSTLGGPERPELERKPATSLTGPEPTFEVHMLKASGKPAIEALRELRELTGLGLRDGMFLLEAGTGLVKRVVEEREAQDLKRTLEAAGYAIEIQKGKPLSGDKLKAPSSLYGQERPLEQKQSSLQGDEVKPVKKESSLYGDDVKSVSKESSLYGDAPAEPAKRSALADARPDGADKDEKGDPKKPWWKRPFG